MIKKGLATLFAVLIMAVLTLSFDTEAKTVNKYATKTLELKEQARQKSKTVVKVKTNTKMTLIKDGKTWSMVEYNGQILYVKKEYLHKSKSPKKYTGRQFRRSGVIRWGGCKWTWYSQRVLSGGGLKIKGRHLDKQGFVCDKDGYIVVAITPKMKKKKAIVPTPFGKYGRCYDCGGGGSAWRDVYVGW